MTFYEIIALSMYLFYGIGAIAVTYEITRIGFLITKAIRNSGSTVLHNARAARQTVLLTIIVIAVWSNIVLGLVPSPGGVIMVITMGILLHTIRDPAILVIPPERIKIV